VLLEGVVSKSQLSMAWVVKVKGANLEAGGGLTRSWTSTHIHSGGRVAVILN
jgi:hypothetical protein